MPPNQAGRELQKIPLGPRRVENLFGIDAHAVKDKCQFIHQRDIQIALGVLDDLCGFRDPNARCAIDTRRDDRAINRRDRFQRLRRIALDHLGDAR